MDEKLKDCIETTLRDHLGLLSAIRNGFYVHPHMLEIMTQQVENCILRAMKKYPFNQP